MAVSDVTSLLGDRTLTRTQRLARPQGRDADAGTCIPSILFTVVRGTERAAAPHLVSPRSHAAIGSP